MGDWKHAFQQVSHGIAVLGAVIALVSFVALVVGGIGYVNTSASDLSVPITIGLTADQSIWVFMGGAAGTVVGGLLHLLGGTAANFVEGFRGAEASGGGGGAAASDGAAESGPTIPASERYRRKLSTFYRGVGLFIALIVGLGLVAGDPATTSANDLVGLVFVFGAIATRVLFGGVGTGLLVVGAFGALWYGVEQAAREALIAGFVVAALFVLLGASAGAVGLIIAGLYLAYYNYLARAATQYQWLTGQAGT